MTPLGFILWAVVIAAGIALVGIAGAIAYGAIIAARQGAKKRKTEIYHGGD